MSVYNRKMFKRNARNALNQSAGIPSVARFQTGGAVSSNPIMNVLRGMFTPTGSFNQLSNVVSSRPTSVNVPSSRPGFSGPPSSARRPQFRLTPGVASGVAKDIQPRALRNAAVAGSSLRPPTFSEAMSVEGGISGLVDQSTPQTEQERILQMAKIGAGQAADAGLQILNVPLSAGFNLGTGLAASGEMITPEFAREVVSGKSQLSPDLIKGINAGLVQVPPVLAKAIDDGDIVVPGLDITRVQAKPLPPAVQIMKELPGAQNIRVGEEGAGSKGLPETAAERIARLAIDDAGMDVDSRSAANIMEGIVMGDSAMVTDETPTFSDDDSKESDAVTLPTSKPSDEEIQKILEEREQARTDASGDPSETGTTGTVAATKEEIENVINEGNEADQKSTLDGFIKEFMDKAPGYEGADSGLILAKIGFAMAAGKSPRAIENIASAMSDGADMLIKDKAKRDEFNRQLKLSALQYGLTETSKISAEERALARANADVVEMVVGKGGTSYNGRDYGEGESIFISKGDLKEGSFPANILGTSAVTALKNQNTATAAALKDLLDRKKITPSEYTKRLDAYTGAVSSAINAESGISLLEGAMVTVTGGNVTGVKGVFKDMVRGGGAFLGMDLSEDYGDKQAVRDAMRAALQDVIPVTLGSTQTANSISNRDVDFLIEAYFGAGALNGGVLTFAAQNETELTRRLQRAIGKMRTSQEEAFATMRRTEDFLAPLYQPGTKTSATGLLAADQARLREAGLMAGGDEGAGVYVGGQRVVSSVGATRGDDGIIRFQTG